MAEKRKEPREPAELRVGSISLPVNTGNPSSFIPREQVYITPSQGYLEKLAYAGSRNLPALLIGENGVGATRGGSPAGLPGIPCCLPALHQSPRLVVLADGGGQVVRQLPSSPRFASMDPSE